MKLTVLGLSTLLGGLPMMEAASQPSTVEREIRALEEQERVAVLASDTTALHSIWAPAFIVNNPQNVISANRAVVFALIAAGRIRHARFDRRIESLLIDGDVAIVMGGETIVAHTSAGPPPAAVERRFTHLWRRTSAGWRLVARHANRIPPP